jgi:hypothetical protein
MYADAGTTRVSSDSDGIYQINDKSGNDNNAAQATLSARPAYKQRINLLDSASLYDGSEDFLAGPINTDFSSGYSIFVVFKPTAAKLYDFISIYNDDGSGVQNRLQAIVLDTGSIIFRAHQNATGSAAYIGRKSSTGVITINNTYLVEGHYDGGSLASGINVFVNGSQVDTADDNGGAFTAVPSATNVPIRVGCQFNGLSPTINVPFQGYIMDVIIYNTEIATGEKQRMRRYLNTKWSIY